MTTSARKRDVSSTLSDDSLTALAPRVERLQEVLQHRMTQPQMTWGSDHSILTEPNAENESIVVRHAMSFALAMHKMPIVIEANDLIVGNSLLDGAVLRTRMPAFGLPDEHQDAADNDAKIATQMGHKTPYYYDLMQHGLGVTIANIEAGLKEVEDLPAGPIRDEKIGFFRAMKMECEGVVDLANRYADLATYQAAIESDTTRRDELLSIAETCRWVPMNAPRSFREAVQSFWFFHYAMFSTGTNISCGRIDQYLYPALKRDLANNSITLEKAQELVDCLWLRFNDRAQIDRDKFFLKPEDVDKGDILESRKAGVVVDTGPGTWEAGHRRRFNYATDAADAINHFGQNVLLSGIKPDGSDGTNELTYLCLNSQEKLAYTSPVVTIRVHSKSPKELLRRTAEVLKSGSGMPYVNNDDVLIQSYVDLGVSLEDARDYANSNCWETMIEGRSDQELIRGMNFLLFLELALNQGESKVHGKMGIETDSPAEFETFEDLMDAWKAQTDEQLKQGIEYIGNAIADDTLEHSNHGKYNWNPLLSAMTLDCIDNKQDVIRNGARYVIWHVMGEAVSNAVNSMSAIKKMVFEDRSLSMDELKRALDTDWDGHDLLRQRLMARAPKWANNDPYADAIAREMMDFFVDRSAHYAAAFPDVIFPCAVGTFSWYSMIGREVGASADGRFAGEPVAPNFSPAPGTDISGPTSAINSYVKMRVTDLAAGAPLDLRFSSSGLRGDTGTDRLAGLIEAFVAMNGNMLTITVTDVNELKAAMEEPEKYRHLRVRMGGWSAYFVMLGHDQQLLHISKVEHGLI
jgi:choline trimethylamine-lyase